jgi:acyl-CoA synthetase (AMP-forming)/AMP-acid ligase II
VWGEWGQQSDRPVRHAQHEGSHNVSADGWFGTGDVANIDRFGHVQLTDRAKDVIKSGGEWISSIDLENVAVGHPQARRPLGACLTIG